MDRWGRWEADLLCGEPRFDDECVRRDLRWFPLYEDRAHSLGVAGLGLGRDGGAAEVVAAEAWRQSLQEDRKKRSGEHKIGEKETCLDKPAETTSFSRYN